MGGVFYVSKSRIERKKVHHFPLCLPNAIGLVRRSRSRSFWIASGLYRVRTNPWSRIRHN